MRRFIRFYLLKTLFALIVIEILILVYYQNRNHAPTVKNENFESFSGKEKVVNILRNDSDEDEDSIYVKEVKTIEGLTINQQGSKLLITISNDYVGTDSIQYIISDGKKDTEGYVKFTINENKAPLAKPDKILAYKGESEIELDILGNDKDAEGDSISLLSYTKPLYGKIGKNSPLTYQIKKGFMGTDSFTYIVSDHLAHLDTATVTIEVLDGKFSPNRYIGNLSNYYRFPSTNWGIKQSGRDKCVHLKEKSGGSNGLLGAMCVLKDKKYTGNLSISVKAKTEEDLKENKWCDYAIIFSYKDNDNYSYAFLNSNPGSSGLFNCVNGEKNEIVKTQESAFNHNEYSNIKVIRRKNKVTVYINGKEILSAENELFANPGLIGVGSANDKACFDNFIAVGNI